MCAALLAQRMPENRIRAVMDAKFRDAHPVSATQIEAIRLCERKWGLLKLDGVAQPPNKYAGTGVDAHKVLEAWQRDGTAIDLNTPIGKIVSAGLRFLPRPGSHHVEAEFLFRTDKATYRGFKDLKSKGPSPIREVWDHKTSSDLRWMKTPEKLRRDPQANLYAVSEIFEAREQNSYVERIEENWVYYLTDPKKPRSRKVQLHVLPDKATRIPIRSEDVKPEHFGIMYYDELFERFAEIESDAEKILQYHLLHEQKMVQGKDLPYDVAGCDAFGGCPYKDKECRLTIRERVESMEAKASLADKIKGKLGLNAGASASVSAPTPTTKPSETAAAVAENIKAEARTEGKKGPEINPPESAIEPVQAPQVSGAVRAGDRMEMTARMAEALVNARHEDARTPVKLAKLAVEYADALLAELAKPRGGK